jgi:hypothetical protein
VQFLVLVMVRRRQVEIAHHIAGRLARVLIGAMAGQVGAQSFQQGQHAVDPLVAGGEHLEGLLESDCGRSQQRRHPDGLIHGSLER